MQTRGTPAIARRQGTHVFQLVQINRANVPPVWLPPPGVPERPAFDYHPDEFNRYTTVISPDRAQRPQVSKEVAVMSADQARTIFDAYPQNTGLDDMVRVARFSTDTELLGEILRSDKILKDHGVIRVQAATNADSPAEFRHFGCILCDFEKWGNPKAQPADSLVGRASNPFRFAPYHEVHIANGPRHNLSEILENPTFAMDFIRMAFQRSRELYDNFRRDISNTYWGMNYGTGRIERMITAPGKPAKWEETITSNASFQHVHAQLVSIPHDVPEPGDRVALAMKLSELPDFFAAYLEALSNSGLLIREYEGDVFLSVPWAQESRHQLRIITPVPNFIVDPEMSVVKSVGQAFHDGLTVMHNLGIRSFNCISFPAPEEAPEGQRLVIDIIPKAKPGLMELAGVFVVDEYPTKTADLAKGILGLLK